MVNISTPTAPVSAGCFSGDGYTHDAQCVSYQGPDPDHQGAEICFNSNTDTLTIVDVTNKGAPNQLSRNSYAGSSYTHQGWLTEDHVYFLMGDELDESDLGHNTKTYVWDVSDLDAPTIVGVFTASTPAIDHNQYVKGGHTYQSNYRAGLRILDLTDIANGNLSEVGFFDIYPSSDSASFNGTWSNFPYYDSGVVVISGARAGPVYSEAHVRRRLDSSDGLDLQPGEQRYGGGRCHRANQRIRRGRSGRLAGRRLEH